MLASETWMSATVKIKHPVAELVALAYFHPCGGQSVSAIYLPRALISQRCKFTDVKQGGDGADEEEKEESAPRNILLLSQAVVLLAHHSDGSVVLLYRRQ